MRRGVLALAALLLVCTLMAGAVSAEGNLVTVTTFEDLIANLSMENGPATINLGGDILATAQITVNRSVTIDGQYNTITAIIPAGGWPQTSGQQKNLLLIDNASWKGDRSAVTLQNITFESNATGVSGQKGAHGVQAWKTGDTPVTLQNIVLNNSAGSGLNINGANVSIANVTIQNSAWGQSIDVSSGQGVQYASNLTITGSENALHDPYPIVNDKEQGINAQVKGNESYTPYDLYYAYHDTDKFNEYSLQKRVWSSAENFATSVQFLVDKRPSASPMVAYANLSVQNSTNGAIPALHCNVTDAFSYTGTGATVTLLRDVDISGYTNDAITIPASTKITLDLNQKHLNATRVQTGNSCFLINVTQGADFTIKGNGWLDVKNVTQDSGYCTRGIHVYGGNLTIENGTFNATSMIISIEAESNVKITGGTFTHHAYGILIKGDGTTEKAPKLTISNATFSGTGTALQSNGKLEYSNYTMSVSDTTITSPGNGGEGCAMYFPSYGVVTLHNVTATGPNVITIDAGELTISGNSVLTSTASNNVAATLNDNGAPEGDKGTAITLEKGSEGKSTTTDDGGYYGNLNITIKDNAKVVSQEGVAIRNYITDKNLVRNQSNNEVTHVVNVFVQDKANVSGKVADIAYQNYTNTENNKVQFVGTNQTANFIFPAAYANFPLKVQYDNTSGSIGSGVHSVTLDLKSGTLSDTFTITITKGNITLPRTAPVKGSEKFAGWQKGTTYFQVGETIPLNEETMIFNATYTGAAAITITGKVSVENTTTEDTPLTASLTGGSAAAFTWELTDGAGIIELNTTSGTTIGYKPLKVGTARLTVSAGSIAKTNVTITVYETAKPELPIQKTETKSDGTTVISNTSADGIAISGNTATIEDTTNNVVMQIVFEQAPEVNDGENITGKVAKVNVTYPKQVAALSPAVASETEEIKTNYTLVINLGNVTNHLPTIDPGFNDSVIDVIKQKNADAQSNKYTFISMITATENVTEINNNISTTAGGVKVTFTVPLSWVNQITKGNPGKINAFHLKSDGTLALLRGTGKQDSQTNTYTFTVTGDSFSSYVLAAYTYTAPSPGPQPASSGGSGNMDGAYRVLFNDGSATLSVATGLSSGDRITAPANPVKDGYTFAGWYKDEACTQAWSFSDGIPGDMTLYAKWTGGSSSSQSSSQQSGTTTQPTAKATSAPASTQSQSGTSATSAPVSTTAASGVSPTMTQAPAPVLGGLFGLLAAGVLLRRRE